jgi:hypothetical protein
VIGSFPGADRLPSRTHHPQQLRIPWGLPKKPWARVSTMRLRTARPPGRWPVKGKATPPFAGLFRDLETGVCRQPGLESDHVRLVATSHGSREKPLGKAGGVIDRQLRDGQAGIDRLALRCHFQKVGQSVISGVSSSGGGLPGRPYSKESGRSLVFTHLFLSPGFFAQQRQYSVLLHSMFRPDRTDPSGMAPVQLSRTGR